MTELAEDVKAFLHTEMRPRVQVDGGDLQFESLDADGHVTIRFRGDCTRCPAAPEHLVGWLGAQLTERFGRTLTVTPIFDKPYYYR